MRLYNEKLTFMEISTDDDLLFKEHIIRIFTGTTNNVPANSMTKSDPEESWMLRRITTLKKDFARGLLRISTDKGNKIPFVSIVKMYHLFVYLMAYTDIDDEIIDQYPDYTDDLWDIQISSNTPNDQRDTIVVDVWNSIHELFIECVYEPFNIGGSVHAGGFCRIKGQDVVIIYKKATPLEKIHVLIDVLKRRDLSEVYMLPTLRELLDKTDEQK
jgi:hypothetical protein